MFWVVVIIIIALILSSVTGRIAVGAGVLALGFWLLHRILDIGFLIGLAKVSAAVIVIAIVVGILRALLD